MASNCERPAVYSSERKSQTVTPRFALFNIKRDIFTLHLGKSKGRNPWAESHIYISQSEQSVCS
jgi:hypothetical protein